MEPKFSGPAYTVGIEEELMILDPSTYALVNAIDDLVEDTPHGEIKPELMESVLEISTNPCADLPEASAVFASGVVEISSTDSMSSGLISPSGASSSSDSIALTSA